jgi:hypothetical protein
MKTPREILLKQHKPANTRLDAIRRTVIACEFRPDVPLPIRCGLKLWRELVVPCRHAWGGLAAIWLVIMAVNLGMRDGSTQVANASQTSRELQMAMWEQQRLVAELIEPSKPAVAVPPKRNTNQPRSDRQNAVSLA